MTKNNKKEKLALQLRLEILRLAARTNTAHVHLGSCLSCLDMLEETILFQMKEEDKFILSKGHASLSLYVVLHQKGKITKEQLDSHFQEGGYFGIHTPSSFPHDIPLPTGSLGHGLSFACGLAKGYMFHKKKPMPRIFCLMSDGECNEGSVWEAALFASHHKLKNIYVLIDKNGFQGIDATANVLGDAASEEKWRSFGFNVVSCDGHDFENLEKAFKKAYRFSNDKPNVIIASTKRGKGIRSIEGKMTSNYFALNEEKLVAILKDLKST